jgi:hypothetical protein
MPAARRLAGACAGGTLAHAGSDTNSSALSSAECAAWQTGFDEMGDSIGWKKCGGMRADPCGCSGVKCVGGNITRVSLNNNGMGGAVPKSWSALTSLTYLKLDTNQLTGDLPAAWSALTSLTYLYLYDNQLTGEAPAAWKSLTSLTVLSLNDNGMTGKVPAEWSALTSLTYLQLSNNELTGEAPAEWKLLTSLTVLSLLTNKLTGEAPAEWSALTSLTFLSLGSNLLTGEAPAAWESLTSLTHLSLNNNKLTGEAPAAWKSLTRLERLYLNDNGMTGVLAADLVPVLQGLSGTCQLEKNRFRCPLPAGLPSKCGATCCNANTFNKLTCGTPPRACSECLACPNATNGASTEGADCFVCSCGGEPCAKGKYGLWTAGANHTCEICTRGRFQDVLGAEGASSCKSCSIATEMAQPDADPGSASKADCVDVLGGGFCGSGQSSSAAVSFGDCQNCTAGRFKEGNNTKPCQACPCGRWQDQPGQGLCDTKCAAGTIGSAKTGKCERCPDDSFCIGNQQTPFAKAARCIPGERERFAPNATSNRVCEPCRAMQYSGVANAARCEPCPAGKFQDRGGQPYCEAKQPCKPGTFDANATDASNARCKPCPAGFWCQDGTQFRCNSASLFCPAQSSTPTAVAIGHYSVNGSDEFHREAQVPCEPGFSCAQGIRQPCPPGRLCQLGSMTARVGRSDVNVTAETLCEVDEFVFGGTCHACPERGAACANGQISLKRNFWYDPQRGSLTDFWGTREAGAAANIYRCAPGSCELNATTGLPACAVGRQGLLCGVCSDGYFATDISGCEPCPAGTDSAAEAVGALLFLAALGAALWRAKRVIEARHPKLAAAISEKLPEVMKLLTGLFQILGAFATVLYRVPWPGAFRAITSATSVLALDVFSLPSLRCSSLGSTFYARFNLHLTSVLVITALFVALLFYAYSRHNQRRARPLKTSLVWNIFLPFLFLIYPSISKTVILMLRCRIVDGHSYLLSDIALSCETAEYARHKSYAIFGVLVFPVGVAVFFTALVGYNRRKLPPDWWPARAPAEAQLAYQKYRAKCSWGSCTPSGRSAEVDIRTDPKPFAAWKAERWDPSMAKYDKLYKRVGFLFFGTPRTCGAPVCAFPCRSTHPPPLLPPTACFAQRTTRVTGGLSPCCFCTSSR